MQPLSNADPEPIGDGVGEKQEGLRKRVFCSSCGASETRRHGSVPLGWQEMPDANGRTMALCPDCVRRSLWMIEARLDIDPTTDL